MIDKRKNAKESKFVSIGTDEPHRNKIDRRVPAGKFNSFIFSLPIAQMNQKKKQQQPLAQFSTAKTNEINSCYPQKRKSLQELVIYIFFFRVLISARILADGTASVFYLIVKLVSNFHRKPKPAPKGNTQQKKRICMIDRIS